MALVSGLAMTGCIEMSASIEEQWLQIASDLIQKNVTSALLGTSWRHKKTGGIYQVIGGCRIEATNKLGILYAREGVVWCRPSEEFLDGRFEAL